jgi:hypothetical protein
MNRIAEHKVTRDHLIEVLAERQALKQYRTDCPTLFAILSETACELIARGARTVQS